MPTSINGFGTRFVGEARHDSEGAFVTTVWIVALYVPLIPLGTFRVRRSARGNVNAIVVRASAYRALPVDLDWRQVAKTYLFVISTLLWTVFVMAAILSRGGLSPSSSLAHWIAISLVSMVALALPAGSVWVARKRSRESAARDHVHGCARSAI